VVITISNPTGGFLALPVLGVEGAPGIAFWAAEEAWGLGRTAAFWRFGFDCLGGSDAFNFLAGRALANRLRQ
jgi:hypothetical protein